MSIADLVNAAVWALLLIVGLVIGAGLFSLLGLPPLLASIPTLAVGIALAAVGYDWFLRLMDRLFPPRSVGTVIVMGVGEDICDRVQGMLPEIQGEREPLPGSLFYVFSVDSAIHVVGSLGSTSILLMDGRASFGPSEMEAIQSLRADSTTAALPIGLFLPAAETAAVDPVQEARRLGVDYVFREPFSDDELKAVLQRCWDVATEGDPYAVRDLGD